jgi:hypothetical protein
MKQGRDRERTLHGISPSSAKDHTILKFLFVPSSVVNPFSIVNSSADVSSPEDKNFSSLVQT